MARQPKRPVGTPDTALPLASESAPARSGVAPSSLAPVLSADERLSPLFRSLRDIDTIEDPDARLQAALDRLDSISQMALGRERTVKNGVVISDPDCNAAVKVEEVAHRLLAIEPRKPKPRMGDLDVFSRPLAVVK